RAARGGAGRARYPPAPGPRIQLQLRVFVPQAPAALAGSVHGLRRQALHLHPDRRPHPVPERKLPGRVRPRQQAGRGIRGDLHRGGRLHRRPRHLSLPGHPPRQERGRPAQEHRTVNPSSSNSPSDNQAEGAQPAANPYQGRVAPQHPDLDAGAPYLNSADVQRMNRKALVFLAGIVLLVVAIAIWIFSGGLSGPSERPARTPPAEQLVIPAAPRDLPELPPERPAPVPELPPLPVVNDYAAAPAMLPGAAPGQRMGYLDEDPRQTLRERRIADASAGGPVSAGGMDAMGEHFPGMGQQVAAAPTVKEAPPDGVTSARPLYSQDTLLLRGTYIRC